MPLTQEMKRKVEAHLSKFPRTCPICGGQNWEIDENLGGMPVFNPDGAVVAIGEVHVFLVTHCQTCKFVRNFQAEGMGILD